MKRRKFILISSAGAAYAGFASCTFFHNGIEEKILAEPIFLHFIWDKEMVISIGKNYALNFPDDDFKAQVDRLIKEDRDDPLAIRHELEQIIHQEFTDEETVMLQGWVLSRTEARQCAIYNHLTT